MLKIGLTGGVGSGKSTVAKYFAALGVPVIDADVVVHELLAHNQAVLAKILEHFGSRVLTADKEIDRRYLRQIIFGNKNERQWLENLLHPLVYQEIEQQLRILKAPYCIIVMPLLFESGGCTIVDRILVINADVAKQIQRTAKRDNVSEKAVSAIIASQANNAWRLSHADDIIDNNGTLVEVQEAVQRLHEFYTGLASANFL